MSYPLNNETRAQWGVPNPDALRTSQMMADGTPDPFIWLYPQILILVPDILV